MVEPFVNWTFSNFPIDREHLGSRSARRDRSIALVVPNQSDFAKIATPTKGIDLRIINVDVDVPICNDEKRVALVALHNNILARRDDVLVHGIRQLRHLLVRDAVLQGAFLRAFGVY